MKYFESPSPCVCMFDVSDIEVKWPFASFSCLHSIVLNSILCNGYFPSYSLSLCLFLSSFFLVRAIIVHTRDVKCGDDAFSMRWFCFLSPPLQLLSLIVFHTNWLKYEYSFHWLSFRFLSSMDGPGWHGSESKLVRLMNVVEQSDKKPSVLTQWQGKDESNKNEIYMRHDTQLLSLSLSHIFSMSLHACVTLPPYSMELEFRDEKAFHSHHNHIACSVGNCCYSLFAIIHTITYTLFAFH